MLDSKKGLRLLTLAALSRYDWHNKLNFIVSHVLDFSPNDPNQEVSSTNDFY
jgi:hypothetical protein